MLPSGEFDGGWVDTPRLGIMFDSQRLISTICIPAYTHTDMYPSTYVMEHMFKIISKEFSQYENFVIINAECHTDNDKKRTRSKSLIKKDTHNAGTRNKYFTLFIYFVTYFFTCK